jgi:uncharacterized membrane protein (UPF0127 family)
VIAAVGVVAVLSACGSSTDPGPNVEIPLEIETTTGTAHLTVEIADSEAEREEGLMGRTSLGANRGMAFLWDEPVESSFWMKDTLIPLSIAFWDDAGRIISILDMNPCAVDPCPSYGPDEPFVGAVEVERGTLGEHGVAIGDQVELTISGA